MSMTIKRKNLNGITSSLSYVTNVFSQPLDVKEFPSFKRKIVFALEKFTVPKEKYYFSSVATEGHMGNTLSIIRVPN